MDHPGKHESQLTRALQADKSAGAEDGKPAAKEGDRKRTKERDAQKEDAGEAKGEAGPPKMPAKPTLLLRGRREHGVHRCVLDMLRFSQLPLSAISSHSGGHYVLSGSGASKTAQHGRRALPKGCCLLAVADVAPPTSCPSPSMQSVSSVCMPACPAGKVWRSQAISLDGLLDYEEEDCEVKIIVSFLCHCVLRHPCQM